MIINGVTIRTLGYAEKTGSARSIAAGMARGTPSWPMAMKAYWRSATLVQRQSSGTERTHVLGQAGPSDGASRSDLRLPKYEGKATLECRV